MKKLVILNSPSGVGKTTYAKKLQQEYNARGIYCYILSTDNYWIRPDGNYAWYPNEIEAAHAWNFAKFSDFVLSEEIQIIGSICILDNTNIRFDYFERYVDLALRSKWEVEIIRLDCPYSAKELAYRNIHKVSEKTLQKQISRWQSNEEMQSQLNKKKEQYGLL